MQEVLGFLKDNAVFYFATVDGNIPRVRPFGFVTEFEGKLYFGTSNGKDVYRQLKKNPRFEVSTAAKSGEWLRLSGTAVFNTNRQTKQAAFDALPRLKDLYNLEDNIFEVFYIENAVAIFNTPQGQSRTVKF